MTEPIKTTDVKSSPVVIVLAAGRGSRFAGPEHKLVQTLGGVSVLGRTIAQAIRSGLPVVVVTTPALEAEATRWVARRDVVLLPDAGSDAAPGLGMGRSIAAGVSARPHGAGWLVLPGDMPLVRTETLQAVAEQLQHHAAAYPQHRARRGHPVGFAAELYSDLVRLSGDEGARRLLARYPSQPIEVDDPGVLMDVDTTDDLARLRAHYDRGLASQDGRAASGV